MRTIVGLLVGLVFGWFAATVVFIYSRPADDWLTVRRYEALRTRLANEGVHVTIYTSTGRVIRDDGEAGVFFRAEMVEAE